MDGYVDALWIGPYGYRKAPEGTLLETGITVCRISAGEAHESDNWKVIGLEELKKDELIDIAEAKGLEVSSGDTKADLVEKIEGDDA